MHAQNALMLALLGVLPASRTVRGAQVEILANRG